MKVEVKENKDDTIAKITLRCSDHPTYSASRAPRSGCPTCEILFNTYSKIEQEKLNLKLEI